MTSQPLASDIIRTLSVSVNSHPDMGADGCTHGAVCLMRAAYRTLRGVNDRYARTVLAHAINHLLRPGYDATYGDGR